MKAILEDIRSGGVEVCQVPAPELRPGGVLVHTLYSAISAGTERAKLETGEKTLLGKALARPDQVRQVLQVAQAEGLTAAYRKVKSRLDSLSPLGYSAAGVVLQVGQGVTDLRPGDRVACGGVGYANHAEINFVPRNLVVHVPDNVDLAAASLTTIGAVAMHGLRQAGVRFGESVAIIGSGLVGLLAVQLARAAGCRVLAFDVDPTRVDFAAKSGAHSAVLADNPQTVATAARQFSPYGIDAAIITAATPSAEPLETAAEILRDRGRIVVVGDVGMGVSRRKLYDKELSIFTSRSYGPGRYDPNYEEKSIDYPVGYVRWTERRNMEAFLALLADGAIDVSALTAERCEIEDAESAYDLIRQKKAYTVILTYPAGADQRIPGAAAPALSIGSDKRETGVGRPRDTIAVSCIGAGAFARDVVFPTLARIRGVQLRAVATSSGASAESARRNYRFAASSTAADIIADPRSDAVFVLSRHDSHASYVAQAMEAGKPVFCEKPLATSRRELTMLSDLYQRLAAAAGPPFVMVGFNRRFAPFTAKVLDFFAARREPMVVHIRVNAGQLPRDHWTHSAGGRIVGEACHFVDFARALVNSPIERVWAGALPDTSGCCRDNVVANLSFYDGSIANLIYVANGDRSVPKESYEIFCAGSVVRLDDFRILEVTHNRSTKKIKSQRDKGHHREFQVTMEAIRSGGPAPIPFAQLVEVTEATFRIAEAVGIPLEHGLEVSQVTRHD